MSPCRADRRRIAHTACSTPVAAEPFHVAFGGAEGCGFRHVARPRVSRCLEQDQEGQLVGSRRIHRHDAQRMRQV